MLIILFFLLCSQLLDELNKVEAVDLGGVSKHTKGKHHTHLLDLCTCNPISLLLM